MCVRACVCVCVRVRARVCMHICICKIATYKSRAMTMSVRTGISRIEKT